MGLRSTEMPDYYPVVSGVGPFEIVSACLLIQVIFHTGHGATTGGLPDSMTLCDPFSASNGFIAGQTLGLSHWIC